MTGKFAGLVCLCAVLAVTPMVTAPAADAGELLSYKSKTIADYNMATRRAVQSALVCKGLYDGEIDGKIGPGTREALARLTGASVQSDFRLSSELVEKIFGLKDYGLDSLDDEARLLKALGREPISRYGVPPAEAPVC